jgi:hypothetical protein
MYHPTQRFVLNETDKAEKENCMKCYVKENSRLLGCDAV